VFGLSGEKLLILGLIAIFVLGPDKLPHYAKQLARLVKSLKKMAEGAKGQLQDELGENVDWKQLDPRQYDPRRIIREALAEGEAVNPVAALNRPVQQVQPKLQKGEVAPFDSEAT
jgi:sec-independent protein translocase protein TatB